MRYIGMAKQRTSDAVDVYDEDGGYLFSLSGTLDGYTQTLVRVWQSSTGISVYDSEGTYKYNM